LIILEHKENQQGIGMRALARQVLEPYLGPLFLKAQEDDPCPFIIEDTASIYGKKSAFLLCNRIRIDMDLC
jgi:hypothetical protein